jgi:hypothetical protein
MRLSFLLHRPFVIGVADDPPPVLFVRAAVVDGLNGHCKGVGVIVAAAAPAVVVVGRLDSHPPWMGLRTAEP